MIVRPMIEADLEALMLLAGATPEAPSWDRAAYHSFLNSVPGPSSGIFIAEIAGDLAGFIASQITLDICELESIAVAPRYRRDGVGSALLAALTAWAYESRVLKIQLEARSANHSAISFYERRGFRRDGLRRGYYRRPEDDAVLMSLTLPEAFLAGVFASRNFPQNQH
ncbi:MAG: GNAT family N-acetyltransferase [Acidobacteriaceae bacterium]